MSVKPIPNHPGYFATSDGQIVSFKKGNGREGCSTMGRIRKQKIDRYGYRIAALSKGGKLHHIPVHRLVLLSFVGDASEGMQVCHNNGIRHDNRLENLRWGSAQENALDRSQHGYRGEKRPDSKLTENAVREIRKGLSDGRKHQSLANEYGVTRGAISGIAQRLTWKHVR